MTQRLLSLLAASVILACGSSQAAEVSSLTNATTFGFGSSNYFGSAPQTVAPGITWTSSYNDSVFGYTRGYGFDQNGSWNGLSMIGSNSPATSQVMTLAFAAPVSGVGMFMNYALGDGGPAVVNAYDSHHDLLDSYTLTFNEHNGSNAGQFVGFQESSADISYLTMGGAYIGGANLEVSTTAVPEASNLALLVAGLGMMGVVARRRKQA